MYPIEGFFRYHAQTGQKFITIYLDNKLIDVDLKHFKLLLDRKFQVGDCWYKVMVHNKELFVVNCRR